MRIIGGSHRGRPLLAPGDEQTTRPITDRVKVALFDRLMSLGYLGQGHVLDVFAGTGSLGLEALSRGADHCTFIERDRHSHARLERNIQALGFADRSQVLSADAYTGAWTMMLRRKPIDLTFLDPPYRDVESPEGQARVATLMTILHNAAAPDGLLILRTPCAVELPAHDRWGEPFRATYGSMTLCFYQAGDPEG